MIDAMVTWLRAQRDEDDGVALGTLGYVRRRILDRYEDCRVRRDDTAYPSIVAIEQMREYEDYVLPALALLYADRPGFEEVWAL